MDVHLQGVKVVVIPVVPAPTPSLSAPIFAEGDEISF